MSETPYDPDWQETNDEESELYGEEDEVSPEEEERFQQGVENLAAHYQAEQDEYNATIEDFTNKYGFVHDCHCAEDWDEGNLGVVSMCYLGMVTDAMNTLEEKITEIREVKLENAKLRIQLADK